MTESIPGSNAVHDSSNPGYATTTTGNDGPSVPKPPTLAPPPHPIVNLQTPYSPLDGTLDKCNHESASHSDHIANEHFLSIELSDQPPTT